MDGVTVVIPSRNRGPLLGETLGLLRDASPPGTAVIVVDSASADATADVARRAGARVIRTERPGASTARNLGWRAAETPLVAFLDDDCRPDQGWLRHLVEPLEDPAVGFVSGWVGLGQEQREGTAMLAVREDDQERSLTGAADLADLALSGNVAYRRAALEQVGGFDEVLGAGAPLKAAEDKDLSWRVLRAGWEGRYTPEARVIHEQWRGRARALRTYLDYGVGLAAFIEKVRHLDPDVGAVYHRQGGPGAQLRAGWRALREGYEYGALVGLAGALGTSIGRVAARRYDIVDDRYVP